MIDLTKAQSQQNTTSNGVNQDWVVTVDGEVIYKLPERFTVQDTFLIKDIAKKMQDDGFAAGVEQQKQLAQVTIDKLGQNYHENLTLLKAENERLATVLEQHINQEA